MQEIMRVTFAVLANIAGAWSMEYTDIYNLVIYDNVY